MTPPKIYITIIKYKNNRGIGSRGVLWTGAPHTLLVDNQRSVKLVIDFIIILSDLINIC